MAKDTIKFIAIVVWHRLITMLGTWMLIVYPVWEVYSRTDLLDYMDGDVFMNVVAVICMLNCAIKCIKLYRNSRHPVYYKLVRINEIDD